MKKLILLSAVLLFLLSCDKEDDDVHTVKCGKVTARGWSKIEPHYNFDIDGVHVDVSKEDYDSYGLRDTYCY